MSKRTIITIFVYVILSIATIIAVSVGDQAASAELKAKGIRAVYEDEAKFAELLKEDGLIYAYGELEGYLHSSDIDLSNMEFRGENRSKKEEKAIKALPESVLFAKFSAYQAFYELELLYINDENRRKNSGKNYEYKEILIKDVYSSEYYVSPSVKFLGQEFKLDRNIFGLSNMNEGNLELYPKDNDHTIDSEYLPSKISGWFELEVKNGEIHPESFKFYREGVGFNYEYEARELAGTGNFIEVSIGVVTVMSILCAITIVIQRRRRA